jgi:large subunit ribosomal protein L4
MASVDVRSQGGDVVGSVELAEDIFGLEPNVPVMHQVVTAQLAARRAGSQSTLTRAEVAGGGAKPWRQKGTGRARQGSNRSPHWRGGGVALGPKPRSFAQKTPKKMVRLALCSALSDRAAEGKVLVLDEWTFDSPNTKDAVAALKSLEINGKVLLVLGEDDEAAWLSFRNLADAHCLFTRELNAYDVLVADYVVFTRETLPGLDFTAEPSEAAVTVETNGEVEAEAVDAGDADAEVTTEDESGDVVEADDADRKDGDGEAEDEADA